jgi:hypothetical protein
MSRVVHWAHLPLALLWETALNMPEHYLPCGSVGFLTIGAMRRHEVDHPVAELLLRDQLTRDPRAVTCLGCLVRIAKYRSPL